MKTLKSLFFLVFLLSFNVGEARSFKTTVVNVAFTLVDALDRVHPVKSVTTFNANLRFSDDSKYCQLTSSSGKTYNCKIGALEPSVLTLNLETLQQMIEQEASQCSIRDQACGIVSSRARWSFLPQRLYSFDISDNYIREEIITKKNVNSEYVSVTVSEKNVR